MTKSFTAWILLFVGLIGCAFGWMSAATERDIVQKNLTKTQNELEIERAKYATGACGDKYAVPIGDGSESAIAGEIVPTSSVGEYYQRVAGDGTFQVVKKNGPDPSPYDKIMVQRVKATN